MFTASSMSIALATRSAWLAEITPLVLLPGIGMVLVGLGFALYAWIQGKGRAYLGWGALAWVIAIAVKFAWSVPVNSVVYQALIGSIPAPYGGLLFDVYVGLLTGVFEVALAWLVLSRIRIGKASWPQALAFGIGFGAVEAILLGLSSTLGSATALLVPDQLPPATVAQFELASNFLYGLAPIAERAATIFVHALSGALIFYAIATREKRWVLLAVVYKTGLDSVAAFAQFWGIGSLGRIWTIEAFIIAFGLIGWWGLRWLADRYPGQAEEAETDVVPVAAA